MSYLFFLSKLDVALWELSSWELRIPPKYFSGMKAVFRVSFPDVFLLLLGGYCRGLSAPWHPPALNIWFYHACVCFVVAGMHNLVTVLRRLSSASYVLTSQSHFLQVTGSPLIRRGTSGTEIRLCEEIRTKIRRLVVEKPFACRYCFKCGLLLPRGCCHMIAVPCHVEMEFVGSRWFLMHACWKLLLLVVIGNHHQDTEHWQSPADWALT